MIAAPRLCGKVCLVTGAGQGIGRAIAERFTAEGASVIAADLGFPGDFPCGSGSLLQEILDVTDEQAVEDAAKRHGDVSVLVNCVGYVSHGAVLDCQVSDFDRSIDLNVRSMFLTIRAFLPAMLQAGNGSIINIASVVSTVKAAPDRLAYATSKAAVLGLTMSVARDYASSRVRCNAISPGTVETPSLQQRLATGGEAARAAFTARQPMGRLGRAEEIASTAALLASDEASFMTGSNIVIDGGMSL